MQIRKLSYTCNMLLNLKFCASINVHNVVYTCTAVCMIYLLNALYQFYIALQLLQIISYPSTKYLCYKMRMPLPRSMIIMLYIGSKQ